MKGLALHAKGATDPEYSPPHYVRNARGHGRGRARAKIVEGDAPKIFEMMKERGGAGSLDVADAFRISPKTVRDIWNRRTWVKQTRHLWQPTDLKPRMVQEMTLTRKGDRRKPGRPMGAKDTVPRLSSGGNRTSPRAPVCASRVARRGAAARAKEGAAVGQAREGGRKGFREVGVQTEQQPQDYEIVVPVVWVPEAGAEAVSVSDLWQPWLDEPVIP